MRLAQLELPARPEFVSLARLIVSSVADARYELTDDQLHDLKLAVSEACVSLIDGDHSPGRCLIVACQGTHDRLEVVVDVLSQGATDEVASSDSGSSENAVGIGGGLPLIASLVDTIDVETSNAGSRVRLTMLAPAADPV